MKFLVSFLLVAVVSFAACLYLPWWVIAIVGFVVALCIPQSPGLSFLAGFLGGFALWGGMAMLISYNNEFILARRMSLLMFKIEEPVVLITATALIGGLVAGLGALSAGLLPRKKEIVTGTVPDANV